MFQFLKFSKQTSGEIHPLSSVIYSFLNQVKHKNTQTKYYFIVTDTSRGMRGGGTCCSERNSRHHSLSLSRDVALGIRGYFIAFIYSIS